MRVENENETSHNKIESRDWEWDESFPWEYRFRDRDESLAEVWEAAISFVILVRFVIPVSVILVVHCSVLLYCTLSPLKSWIDALRNLSCIRSHSARCGTAFFLFDCDGYWCSTSRHTLSGPWWKLHLQRLQAQQGLGEILQVRQLVVSGWEPDEMEFWFLPVRCPLGLEAVGTSFRWTPFPPSLDRVDMSAIQLSSIQKWYGLELKNWNTFVNLPRL